MTREAPRSVEGQPRRFHRRNSHDADVLSSLWEEVPFARLPFDAPKELAEYIVDVDNPKRVYAIHRASRRHNFQLLVEKYIVQLRYGCDSPTCSTSTCFSFRKRLAGKTPIRRYSTTSARTLACYLASQDNPENGLCPQLSPPKAPPAALNSLIFAPKRPPIPSNTKDNERRLDGQDSKGRTPTQASLGEHKDRQTAQAGLKTPVHSKLNTTPHARKNPHEEKEDNPRPHPTEQLEPPAFTIHERPVSKDYRSFAANVFGSVAFKMLEWLTPNGVAAMSEMANEFESDLQKDARPAATALKPKIAQEEVLPTQSRPYLAPCDETPTRNHSRANHTEPSARISKDSTRGDTATAEAPREPPREPPVEWGSGLPPITRPSAPVHRTDRPAPQRRNSNARVRAASKSKPKRQMSIDTFPPNTDEVLTGLRSPRLAPGTQPEKATKPFMTTTPSIARSLAQASEELFQRNESPEPVIPPHRTDIPPVKESTTWPSPKPSEGPHDSTHCSSQDTSETNTDSVGAGSDTGSEVLPQSLSRLNLEIVDLLCDILQEDGTTEKHVLEPPSIQRRGKRIRQGPKALKRKSSSRKAYPPAMKHQWRIFIEQSLFHVLSDPYAIVNSFTTENGLLDSHTLWYCMLRITRVAPSLALDSLWMAASSLFAPPKRLHTLRSPTTRVFRIPGRSLSSKDASNLLAICLHALVATVPLVTDSSALFDISRLRSHGLSMDNSGGSSTHMATLCLQYDDAFSDELALRLARRLFAAISTRRGFQELLETDLDFDSDAPETDILDTILSQLESITEDSSASSSSLLFTHFECELHEKRVPSLLLDWARAVMLSEWNGQPEVNAAGPFGGALALITAMFEKRHSFHIGDVDFRAEYFPDRMDSVEMPIAWLSNSSNRQKRHLLDYPYLFNPSSLVSYFRAINFSRMNRSYEESSSLLNRMRHIMQQGSLISNDSHKQLLSEMLHTASLQYLVLEIRRRDPLKDAFDQLWRREERELLRPLKVHLGEDSGEEGFDSGGVQQEFFRLALAHALDPAYGLFTVDERTQMTWFRPGGLEPEWKFELIGLLFSLAVYNGLTLPVTFPKALYRKLLGEPVTDIHHIADGWPELANGLTTLLEWDEKDGTVEDIFARTYEFSVEAFGVHVSREMASPGESAAGGKEPRWPQWNSSMAPPTTGNPEDAPMVTGENRNAYVSDYVKYLTHVSVAPQYAAFERGFRTVLHPKSLSLLSPPLLQNVVEGIQMIDISELRRTARYVGWDPSHRTIRDFWSIVKRYDEPMKRKLLEFVTASDRVPVGGIRNLQFVIQKNGEEGEGGHLPTAYTCYGTLLLPEYKDKEVLRERLGMALQNAQGFGFA